MTAEGFDEVIDRRRTGSYKWDSADEDTLPMWVADMDFRTAPAVVAALERRVRHGVFGYTKVRDAYYEALIDWSARRHGAQVDRAWVLPTSGVVPAISAVIRALTDPGDAVIVQTPVYNCFFSSIRNMGCEVVENPLAYRGGRYELDLEGLERLAAGPRVRALLLCHPHNPVGRVWTHDELAQLGEICARHGVVVISDEVHADLTLPGHTHVPFSAAGPEFAARSVTCTSPSKAFNLAGLQIANILVADPTLRARVDRALNVHEVCDVNPFGVEALIAAYTEGEAWLESLRLYLDENRQIVHDVLEERLPQVSVVAQEATYLSWIDCTRLGRSSNDLARALRAEGKLWISEGTLYGPNGEGFVRLNIACPASVLRAGLDRLCRTLG